MYSPFITHPIISPTLYHPPYITHPISPTLYLYIAKVLVRKQEYYCCQTLPVPRYRRGEEELSGCSTNKSFDQELNLSGS